MRYNVDFKYKIKLKKHFYFGYRLRYQKNSTNLFKYISDIEQKSNLRNRLHLEYSLKKHSIYFATELFREYIIYKKPAFNSLRMSIGDKLKTNHGDFNYSFLYDYELNKEHPLNMFIFKINYTFHYKND